MQKELEKIKNVLGHCDLTDLWTKNLDDNEYYSLDSCEFKTNIIDNFKKYYKKHFEYDKGATKAILMFPQYGFVLKIPFDGDEDGEYAGAKIYDSENNKMIYCGNDYCKVEELLYNYAKINGLEDFFAKVECIGKCCNRPIYYQEYAQILEYCDNEYNYTYSKDDVNTVKTSCKNNSIYGFNEHWLSEALAYYGEEKFNKFIKFIKKYKIDDLHSENIGYIKGRPVLIDYAGYNS